MQDLIGFIDSFAGDKKYFWQISFAYKPEKADIAFFGNKIDNKWAIKLTKEDEWTFFNKDNFLRFLDQEGISFYDLEVKLRSSSKSMAVYAYMLFEEAEKILGKDFVTEAVEEYKQFSKELIRTVESLLAQKSQKSHLQAHTRQEGRSHNFSLRLIKNQSPK